MSSDAATLYLSAFIDELVRSGLRHIVVSPGSRSTPLAVLAAEHKSLKVWMNIDERSAAFFALGLAKASRETVALLCTSGTAAANYFPAITEANLSRVPLLVLTADRPHELRDVGAPQTINQIGLYGEHVKWFSEMPIPEDSPAMLRHARVMASRSLITADQEPKGPVHLNFPLREPLLPNLDHPQLFGAGREENSPYVAKQYGDSLPNQAAIEQLANQLKEVEKGIIVCGPIEHEALFDVVIELANALQYPIVADPLSQLRSYSDEHIIDAYDSFLREQEVVKSLQPDVFIRIGAMPVSKPMLQYMNAYPNARHIVVDEAGWRDPTLLISDRWLVNPITFCKQLAESLQTLQHSEIDSEAQHAKTESGVKLAETQSKLQQSELQSELQQSESHSESSLWLRQWHELNQLTAEVLQAEANMEHRDTLFEGRVVTELQQLMPAFSTLFVGNSMPIRDVDTFFSQMDKPIRIMANRGANGIDGLVSTALGVSAHETKTVLLLGDLSFYHDLNGLLASKLYGLNITIVVINNDGGGIFSFLPQAALPNHYEMLFGTPIGLDYEKVVSMYGGQFTRVNTWEQFREAFQLADATGGLQVIEVPTDRNDNVALHRGIWPKMAQSFQHLL